MHDNELTEKIISCAYQVHNKMGGGFLEKVYENALLISLRKQGLQVVSQFPVNVYYEAEVVGEYVADLLVENRVIIEVKSVKFLGKDHEKQLVNYLSATGFETGLLINFGQSVEIKRKFRNYMPSNLQLP